MIEVPGAGATPDSIAEMAAGRGTIAAHEAHERRQGFYRDVAEASGGAPSSPPTGSRKTGDAQQAPILIPPVIGAFVTGTRNVEQPAFDLTEASARVEQALAEATEKLAAIDAEIDQLKMRQPDLQADLARAEEEVSTIGVLAARAVLDGDKSRRAQLADRRGRAEAAVRDTKSALGWATTRLEALRIERIRAAEETTRWSDANTDVQLLSALPAISSKFAELGELLAPLADPRRAVHIAAIQRSGDELRNYIIGTSARLAAMLHPRATPRPKVFLPADTAIQVNRDVSYQSGASGAITTVPYGHSVLVPAHIASKIIEFGAGQAVAEPSHIEIRALVGIERVDKHGREGSIPAGWRISVPSEEAEELCRQKKAERTGLVAWAPGQEPPVRLTRPTGPLLELGYVEPDDSHEQSAGHASARRLPTEAA